METTNTSFGLHPPLKWEKDIKALGKKYFIRNNEQIQWDQSVRCGYYCILFLNERNEGTSYKNILSLFTDDVLENEKKLKKYFS